MKGRGREGKGGAILRKKVKKNCKAGKVLKKKEDYRMKGRGREATGGDVSRKK